MKAISNIYLAWRKGKGSRRILVGVIRKNVTDGIRFTYLSNGIEEAKKFGFTSYDGFPDLDKEYKENVIEIFGQRIIRSERNDIDDFFKFWMIKKKIIHDNFYMLAYTQGLLPTDNFEFLADFYPKKGLSFITEISGLSRSNITSEALDVGDNLNYKLEPSNEQDASAVQVLMNDLALGYIKRVHCNVFSRTGWPFKVVVHHIEKNGTLSRVFLHVSL